MREGGRCWGGVLCGSGEICGMCRCMFVDWEDGGVDGGWRGWWVKVLHCFVTASELAT